MILEHRPSTKKPTSLAASKSTVHHETEKPPPYTHNGYENRLPPVPEASGSSRIQNPSASSSRFSETPTVVNSEEEPAVVNSVHLVSKNEDIVGKFFIDPRPPIPLNSKKKRSGKKGPFIPNASFKSSSGGIQIMLGTTGDVKEFSKATVSVASGSGSIDIQVLPIAPTRPRIGLDATSHQGDIVVHLPETFSGVIQLNTRKGELHVLPMLMQRVKVLKVTGKETLLLMGASGVSSMELGNAALTDLCQLNSRSGKVVVGLSGLDKPPEKTGFWKKVGQFFRG